VAISDYNQALRSWGLKKLTIERAKNVGNLAACLNDPTSRMARQLLCIYAYTNAHDISDSTRSNLAALEAHDGEYLPVTDTKFPVQSKVAVISVIEQASSSENVPRFQVMSHMDSSVLSLIFAFAGTPAQRAVDVV
jgi:glucosamine 6-phosphate synthetase-like amidotransferase/phosphosugar isomerase protein